LVSSLRMIDLSHCLSVCSKEQAEDLQALIRDLPPSWYELPDLDELS
jgi:hypothetical protein